jgi:hypothetical protein
LRARLIPWKTWRISSLNYPPPPPQKISPNIGHFATSTPSYTNDIVIWLVHI